MSGFNSKPTPAFTAAVAALQQLDWDNQGRAFAEASSIHMRQRNARQFGEKADGKTSWKRLIGQRGKDGDKLPGDDNIELRSKDGVLTYTSQPYQLSMRDLREILAICDEYDLEVNIDASGWYFTGRTLRVSYSRAPD